MKNKRNLFFLGLLLLISTSCVQVTAEINALKKNEQGLSEFNQGQFENAIKYFREAIQSPKLSNETRATIYRNIAQTYIEMEIQDSAIYYSTKATDCYDKNSYDYLVNIADIEILTGETASALDNLKKAYLLKPNDLAVNNTLGLIYLGDYGDEFQDVERALSFNKKAFEINKDRTTEYVLARNYYDLEQFDEAEKHFEKLNRLYPNNLLHPLTLGMVKYRLNAKYEAEQLWEQVLKVDSIYYYVIEAFKDEVE